MGREARARKLRPFVEIRHETTAAHARRYFPGSVRIAPGLWIDGEGNPHWSVPELLALVDLPDTPENRAAVIRLARESMDEHLPETEPILILQKPDA